MFDSGRRVASSAVLGLICLALGSGIACAKKGDNAAGAAAAAPAKAAPAKAPGAESPEALVERMKKAAANEDLSEMAACMTPKSRAEMAMGMYLGATMMVAFSQMGAEMGGAMAEGMGGMAEGMTGEKMDPAEKKKMDEQLAKAKQEMGKVRENYNTLVAKYGLPTMPKDGEPEPPELSQEEVQKKFESMDVGAFLTDVMAFMKSMPGDEAKSESPVKIPTGALTDLKIEGDKATGSLDGEALTFVKIDGRWYVEEPGPGEAPAMP